MNKEEIDILYSFANDEDCRYVYDWQGFNYEEICPLIDKLIKENKQLKGIIKENTILVKDEYGDYQECNINPLRMKQKYEKLKDNWNKLKEYIKERFYFNEETGEYSLLHTFDKDNIKELLDILNEVSE